MMNRSLGGLLAGLALVLATAGACPAYRSPCLDLAPPTQQELAAVASGSEVERELEDVECELRDGSWQEEVETE